MNVQDQNSSLDDSAGFDDDSEEDDMEMFNNEMARRGQPNIHNQSQNEFYKNDWEQIQGQISKDNNKNKRKERKAVSKEKQHLKAYIYLIQLWTIKDAIQSCIRMERIHKMMNQRTGTLLSRMSLGQISALISSRGQSLEVIAKLVVSTLGELNIMGEGQLLEKLICVFTFCEVECKLLTLSNLERFRLFQKFKIHSKPYRKMKNQLLRGHHKIREYIKKNELDRESEKDQDYLDDDLDKYTFRSQKFTQHFAHKRESSQRSVSNSQTYNYNFKLNQNVHLNLYEWLELYSSHEGKWRIFSLHKLAFREYSDIKNEVEGVATVFIYSCKLISTKPQFDKLLGERPLKHVELIDQTFRFCDNWLKIRKRRFALELKKPIENIVNFGKYAGPNSLLTAAEIASKKSSIKAIEHVMSTLFFPKTLYQFKVNQWFVIPSQLNKFEFLSRQSQPLQGLEFQNEKVFLRSQVDHMHSSNGWIDVNRMVKDSEIAKPRKETLNRKSKQLKLYTHDQTIPYKWELEDGKFTKNEFSSIYINKYTKPPEGVCIIKQRVAYVCKKNGLQYAEVIQGFNNHGPNVIGYAIMKNEKARILKLQEERVKELAQKKAETKEKNLVQTWRKLFKSILITETLQHRYASAVN